MTNRIAGFDLARAYAIFGMFIVNFNTVFGSQQNNSVIGKLLCLFNGNSSSAFVILAGMGVALMSIRSNEETEKRTRLRKIVVRRSWFLFAVGLVLYWWWPADILHFYGAYLHFAAALLFVPKKFYLICAGAAVIIFHFLLYIIPFEQGWNFDTLSYNDFFTIRGFLRNTFYNGWNPIFPWLAYFLFGMWLGHLNWQNKLLRRQLFVWAAGVFAAIETAQMFAQKGFFNEELNFYFTADYLPPFLPFMISTSSFALMLLLTCVLLTEKFHNYKIFVWLSKAGQMTLTHYISHLTIGMLIFATITGKKYSGQPTDSIPTAPPYILCFSVLFYIAAVFFSHYWAKKFTYGPIESVMRKITG
jgi:uncharacterized protein